MVDRKKRSARDRVRIFDAAFGVCHMCGLKIDAGQEWEASHRIPLACGGADDMSNLSPAHKRCHRKHTAKVDAPLIAKVRRQHQAHIGATRPAGKLQSRGFATQPRERKRLTKPCAGQSEIARRCAMEAER